MQPGRERRLVTSAILLGMFLAALEATAVATAVPTAVGELGGVAHYSWVFSAYLLTSTTTVPLFGKLADLFGRKRTYLWSVAIFLLGSALCGFARSFPQLILFRAIQGLGAGGVSPVATTIVGDIYTLEERGRIQGIFSGIWAMASLVGPLLGGLLTDHLSWRWIFYLNIPFGLLSAVMLQRWMREESRRTEHRLDILGTVSLTTAVTLLLLALLEGPGAWIMLAMMITGFGLGFLSMPYVLGVQNAVPWRRRGVATSSVQFFRNVGGAVSVAALGALLNARLQAIAGPGVDANAVLEPAKRARLATLDPGALHRLTSALLHGLQGTFVAIAALSAVFLLTALLFPRGSARSLMDRDEARMAEGS